MHGKQLKSTAIFKKIRDVLSHKTNFLVCELILYKILYFLFISYVSQSWN